MSGKLGRSEKLGSRPDVRVARTRAALLAAFNRVFLTRRERHVHLREVIEQAGIGRSTFYNHYSSADDLLLDALRPPLTLLAEVAMGRGDPERLAGLLRHFWHNRQRARDILGGRLAFRTELMFTDMIEALLEETISSRRLAARIMANALIAPIRSWLVGEAPSSPEALAKMLDASSRGLAAAIGNDAPPQPC